MVTYSELTGAKVSEDEFKQILSRLERGSTFHLLSTINCFLSLTSYQNSDEDFIFLQRFLSHHLLDKELFDLTNEKLSQATPLERPIFHRWQILYLMKRVLLESSDKGDLVPHSDQNQPARETLGRLCLIVNDFFMNEQDERALDLIHWDKAEDREQAQSIFLAQMLPVAELYNPPPLDEALARLDQMLQIFEHRFPLAFGGTTLSDYFRSLTGINLESFIEMTLGIHAHYLSHDVRQLIENPIDLNLNRKTFFSNLNYSDSEIDHFFRLVSGDLNQLTEAARDQNGALDSRYDLRLFQTYPLFRISGDSFTCIDYGFLLEKVLQGLYHTILNSLPNNERRVFFEKWGKVFEEYVTQVFLSIFPASPFSNFYPHSYFLHKQEMEAFDGMLEYSTDLIAMEYKGGVIKAAAKYSGNPDELLGDIDKKFGTVHADSGVRQLAQKIERLFTANVSERLQIRDLDLAGMRVVYPVLVVNDSNLGFSLTALRLRSWFDSEIENRNIDPAITIRPLCVLPVGELEEIKTYLLAGDFTLLDFLHFYANAVNESWYHPLSDPDNVWKDVGFVFTKFRDARQIPFRPNQDRIDGSGRVFDRVSSKFRIAIGSE